MKSNLDFIPLPTTTVSDIAAQLKPKENAWLILYILPNISFKTEISPWENKIIHLNRLHHV